MSGTKAARIYICHTYYHVYVACLKELHFQKQGKAGTASLMLSTMSTDFADLPERAKKCPLFAEVLLFPERPAESFPELVPLKKDTGSALGNLRNRIRFCRRLGELTAPLLPTDLRTYEERFVFCDSDPIGYYLNYAGIRYHALEDGLNCLQHFDAARYDNRDHFALKAMLAKTGLLFIQNGWGRYCIDMEVNDIGAIKYPCPKYVEVQRRGLVEELTAEDKELLLALFVANKEELEARLSEGKDRPRTLVLSEPLCDPDTRLRLFRDIVDNIAPVAGAEKTLVLFKKHPRDLVEYGEAFADCVLLDGSFPMEMLGFVQGLSLKKVVSVYTVVDGLDFAKEKVYLGHDFMDRYEDPRIHRKNEEIGA